MNKSKYDLVDIAQAGASLVLDASKFSKYDLVNIAEAIQDGCGLELFGCDSISKYDLVKIAEAAPGKVTLRQ